MPFSYSGSMLWFPLNTASKWMLVFSGEVGYSHSPYFRFFVGVNSAFDHSLIVRPEHDPFCGFVICLEEALYDVHDKFHGSGIIVEEQHAPHRLLRSVVRH